MIDGLSNRGTLRSRLQEVRVGRWSEATVLKRDESQVPRSPK